MTSAVEQITSTLAAAQELGPEYHAGLAADLADRLRLTPERQPLWWLVLRFLCPPQNYYVRRGEHPSSHSDYEKIHALVLSLAVIWPLGLLPCIVVATLGDAPPAAFPLMLFLGTWLALAWTAASTLVAGHWSDP